MKVGDAYPSKYLAASDLDGKDVTVTIADVQLEDIGQGHNKESKLVITMESAAGVMIAAPNPCTARATISIPSDCASPQTSEAIVKSATPTMNTRRRPSRSAARPASKRNPPNAIEYAVMTHCRFSREKWSERLIEGRATFTIETSRIVMKNAVATTARILHRCGFDVMTRLG